MKTFIIILCITLVGCVTAQPPPPSSPPHDIYVYYEIPTPMGSLPVWVHMEKGYLDDSENYMTRKEYEKWKSSQSGALEGEPSEVQPEDKGI